MKTFLNAILVGALSLCALAATAGQVVIYYDNKTLTATGETFFSSASQQGSFTIFTDEIITTGPSVNIPYPGYTGTGGVVYERGTNDVLLHIPLICKNAQLQTADQGNVLVFVDCRESTRE